MTVVLEGSALTRAKKLLAFKKGLLTGPLRSRSLDWMRDGRVKPAPPRLDAETVLVVGAGQLCCLSTGK
ncbi:unnamed protein product [Rangifer tarandus platyrhynchus]|uniref:Uncharacterized protein n=1 Tax=Rangifer tarandus platyrhynchus TaxID=3082113 RepID=A0AC59YR74_RANTA